MADGGVSYFEELDETAEFLLIPTRVESDQYPDYEYSTWPATNTYLKSLDCDKNHSAKTAKNSRGFLYLATYVQSSFPPHFSLQDALPITSHDSHTEQNIILQLLMAQPSNCSSPRISWQQWRKYLSPSFPENREFGKL